MRKIQKKYSLFLWAFPLVYFKDCAGNNQVLSPVIFGKNLDYLLMDELTLDPHANVTLILHQHSLYSVLADTVHIYSHRMIW
jgi:hypothetical protein